MNLIDKLIKFIYYSYILKRNKLVIVILKFLYTSKNMFIKNRDTSQENVMFINTKQD